MIVNENRHETQESSGSFGNWRKFDDDNDDMIEELIHEWNRYLNTSRAKDYNGFLMRLISRNTGRLPDSLYDNPGVVGSTSDVN